MRFAFCLFRYFPFGGLQRDAFRLAAEAVARGHTVCFFCREWQGPQPENCEVILLPITAATNSAKDRAFVKQLQQQDLTSFDLIMGFNKMPGLDCYYAADPCYAAKVQRLKPFWYYWTPRHRHLSNYERSVFTSKVDVLLIAAQERAHFQQYYSTPVELMHELPPGIALERKRPDNAAQIRKIKRQELNLDPAAKLILLVGSGFRTKGVDRAIKAIAALPADLKAHSKLFIVGSDNSAPFLRMARRLGVTANVQFLGARNDVRDLMLAADILLHPAYSENTGTALLEALVAGLPVIATDICGYAVHILLANAGVVISSPFQQDELNACLTRVLQYMPPEWSANALAYAATADLYSMPQKALDLIETFAERRYAAR